MSHPPHFTSPHSFLHSSSLFAPSSPSDIGTSPALNPPRCCILQCPFLRHDTRHHIIFPRSGSHAFQQLLPSPLDVQLPLLLLLGDRRRKRRRQRRKRGLLTPQARLYGFMHAETQARGKEDVTEYLSQAVNWQPTCTSEEHMPVSVCPPFSTDHLSPDSKRSLCTIKREEGRMQSVIRNCKFPVRNTEPRVPS